MPFLANNLHLWRIWRSILRISIIRELEFRTNFLLGFVRELCWLAAFTFNIEVIFQHTQTLSGWQKPEMLVILALSRLLEGIMQAIFISNIMEIPTTIQKGTFDFILTKPLPSQWQSAFRRVTIYNVGNIIAGITLLIYVLTFYHLAITLPGFLAALVVSLLGITVYYSLLMTAASMGFWLERLQAIWAINYLMSEPLTVPLDVFPSPVRIALTYLLPIAFVVFVPAQALTGRLQWWQVPVAMLIAVIFLTLANLAWRAGLRRYSSASS